MGQKRIIYKSNRKGKTDNGRIIFTTDGERPNVATINKKLYTLWKFVRELSLNEIQALVSKRKNDLKYEKDKEKIQQLRTEIRLLLDVYKIKNRK